MADVTISQLTRGTPVGSNILPYSTGNNTLGVPVSAIFENARHIGINSSSAKVPLEVANIDNWPYNMYVSGNAPNIYFGQNSGKFPNPGGNFSYIANPLTDAAGPAAAFIGYSTNAGNYSAGLGDLNICTQSFSANNSNAINFMVPADDLANYKLAMKINKQGIVTKLFQPAFHVLNRTVQNNLNTNTVISFSASDAVVFNQGNYFLNNRFNAPVNGVYCFSVNIVMNSGTVGAGTYPSPYWGAQLTRNNTSTGNFYFTRNTDQQSLNFSATLKLNVGDYVDVRTYTSGTMDIDNSGTFSGHLVG